MHVHTVWSFLFLGYTSIEFSQQLNHTFQIVCFQFKKFSAQLLYIIGVNRLIFIAAFCNLVYAAGDSPNISRLLFKHLKIVVTHFAPNQLFPAISGEVCHPGFLHFPLNDLKLFFRKKEQFADRSFSVLFHLSGPFLVKRAWGIFPKTGFRVSLSASVYIQMQCLLTVAHAPGYPCGSQWRRLRRTAKSTAPTSTTGIKSSSKEN